ncbi:MAG: Abi-alpha family protein [Solirubrobacterales bacterium]
MSTEPIGDDGDARREEAGFEEREHSGALDTVPGLARLGAGAWLRTAQWYVGNSLRVGSRLARAATSRDAAADLIEDTQTEMRAQARRLLGIVDSEGRVADAVSELLGDSPWLRGTRAGAAAQLSLRDRGERLLQASADVHYRQGTHPAYERILSDLAPDEARILRLMAVQGPQPAVDVRAGLALVPGSRLVTQGFSMIGAEAGCRFVDQVPAYLNNLNRLGLVWFAREPVRNRERYQVIEVQPEILEALRETGRFSHVVRRSIHLTPLGEDFCAVALPLDTAEFEALEQHEVPDE